MAQLPTANFSIPANVCSNEDIEINNLSTNATKYFWDFCEGDLFELPTFQNIGLISGSFNPKAIDVVKDSDLWYGFITSKSTNSLYRVDFGVTLDNPSPIITDLGNIAGILSGPEPIKIVNESGNWYAFIINGANSTLVRLSFGASLGNMPTGELILSNISTFNSGIDIGQSLSQKVLVASNFTTNEVTMVNFGNSFTNTPLPADIITTSPISGAAGSGDIEIFYNEGLWYGFLLAPNSKKIFRLDYGNALFSIPTSTDITGTIVGTEFIFGIEIARDKGEFIGLIQTNSGNLIRVYFGNTINNNSPTSEDLGNFGILQNNTAFKLLKDLSQWYVFTIDTPNKILLGGKFPNLCSASSEASFVQKPYGINYSDQGKKHLSLLAFNSNNEFDYKSNSITISPSLAPQMDAQITGNCLTSAVNFSGQELSGNITNWNWDFGDGVGTSNSQNAIYTYAASGTYQVRLSVTDANGCNNLLIDSVKVYEEPLPDFTFPAGNLCMYNPVSFTNTTLGETGPAVTWTWDFNGEGTSTEKEPLFTFLSTGTKTVTLTSSIPGCANVTQQTIFIEEAPTTNFSFNNVCNGQATTFTDLTLGNDIISYNWDFGDGNNSADQNPSYTYAAPGKYIVTLTVANNLGCSTSKPDTVYNHALPTVNFTYDLPCSSTPIQFNDQSIVQDAGLVAWDWDFGDGNTSTIRNPQHTYGQTGDFTVQLKVYSQYGCVDSTESIISVIQGPEVDFGWDKSCVGEETSFSDNTDSGGRQITNWTWLIDNTIFTQQNPKYTFTSPGTYSVQLSVTTDNLCAQTISDEIFIEAIPVTSFDYFESCNDNTVTFYDTSPATINTRVWRIDGTVTATDSIMIKVLNPGYYEVSLAATSARGCLGTVIQDINIAGPPAASFSATAFYGAVPLKVQFDNQSNGAENYFWQFGDAGNTTSIDANPEFIYTATGTYNVTLIASGGQNCSDTTIQTIEVVEPEHAMAIDGITLLDGGRLALTLSNLGSITYDEDNSKLIFTLDNGAELTEAFTTMLYPNNTINYVPLLTLGEIGNAKTLCVKLQYSANQTTEILDENCVSLSDRAVIINAYPNPATNYINLSVVLVEDGKVDIKLIDSNGATILIHSDDSALQGLNNYTIDTTPYSSGLYIIKIESGNVAKEMKVVIDK